MEEGFSLLKHLNVKVAVEGEERAPRPAPRAAEGDDKCISYRAWSPASRPPSAGSAPVSSTQDERPLRRAGAHAYADPTGEVIRVRDKGESVEYTVYDARVPSIHGVNRQLAERKRREAAERLAQERAESSYPSFFGHNTEQEREETRHRLLDELRRCNMEQAQRRHEESIRDERYRMERDLERLRAVELAESQRLEKERQRKLEAQLAVREAAEAAIAERRRRDEAEQARASAEASDFLSFMPGHRDSAQQRAPERLLSQQQLAEENRKLAEERAEARRLQALRERDEERRANEEALLAMQAENQRRTEERERNRRAFQRHAMEAAERKRQAAQAAVEQEGAGGLPLPAFAVDDAVAERRRAERFKADQEVNRRLAEQRRERERAAEEHERTMDAARTRWCQEEEARAAEQERAARIGRQAEMREAVERAQRNGAARRAAAPEECAMPFYLSNREAEMSNRREQQQREMYEDLRRQAEQRRQQRLDDARQERESNKALMESARRAAEEEERVRRARERERKAQLQRDLEQQIEEKRRRSADVDHHPAQTSLPFPIGPTTQSRALYRCPVTHELLPASEYDFGTARR